MDEKGKKIKTTAPQYVDYVMTYIQKTLNDEPVFPSKPGKRSEGKEEYEWVKECGERVSDELTTS